MSTSEAFDRLMNGKPMKEKKSTRSVEDFMAAMQRVSTQHEKET